MSHFNKKHFLTLQRRSQKQTGPKGPTEAGAVSPSRALMNRSRQTDRPRRSDGHQHGDPDYQIHSVVSQTLRESIYSLLLKHILFFSFINEISTFHSIRYSVNKHYRASP